MPLPTVRLKDIGKDGSGATPEEIATQIMDAVLKGAQNAVASAKIDADKLTGAAMEEVEKAAGEATKALEGATEGAGSMGQEAGDAVKGLIKGLGKQPATQTIKFSERAVFGPPFLVVDSGWTNSPIRSLFTEAFGGKKHARTRSDIRARSAGAHVQPFRRQLRRR